MTNKALLTIAENFFNENELKEFNNWIDNNFDFVEDQTTKYRECKKYKNIFVLSNNENGKIKGLKFKGRFSENNYLELIFDKKERFFYEDLILIVPENLLKNGKKPNLEFIEQIDDEIREISLAEIDEIILF